MAPTGASGPVRESHAESAGVSSPVAASSTLEIPEGFLRVCVLATDDDPRASSTRDSRPDPLGLAGQAAGAARWPAPGEAARARALEHALDHGLQAATELRAVEPPRVGDARRRVDRQGVERQDGLRQRSGLRAIEERAGDALDDGLAHAALVERDHRAAGGLRLD